jgi:hydroxyquinol 1,2-dioxygenase
LVDITTDVLIIGTGPAGSATAALLSSYGVANMVVNRYRWLANTPRAHITNQRTMEVLRDLGREVEDAAYLFAPELPMGSDICLDAKGEPMLVRGRILDTHGAPIAQAKIDVWQANDEGFYDVQQKGIQPDFNLRGVFRTGPDGRYWFRGVKPRFYPIPDDGPVGALLTALGRAPYRPAHLYYSLEAQGFEKLVTHIFDPDDPHIASDAVFGVKQSLLAKFDLITDPARIAAEGMPGPFHLVEHDFVLAPAK